MRVITKMYLTLLCLLTAGVMNVSAVEDEIFDFDGSFYHTWSEVSATATDNGEAGGGVKLNEGVGAGGAIWGNLTGAVPHNCYANITDYSELRFEGTPNAPIRIMCNRTVNEGPIFEISPKIGEDGKLTVKISDLKYLNGGAAADFVCLQAIKVPWGVEGNITITSIKIVKPGDPLSIPKEALKNSLNQAKLQTSFAKTEESFAVLTQAIADGDAALAANDATSESLAAAKTAVDNAIAGLQLQEGYTAVTASMFFEWDSATEPTTSKTTGCDYNLFTPTSMVFGNSSVALLTFVDMSAYDKFYVTTASGTPRILLNRDVNDGQWNENEAESHLIDNTREGWSSKYFTTADNVTTVDLATLVQDKGFAHLHSIKGANGGNVVVTGLYLYKAPAAPAITPAYGTIWENGETTSEEGQTVITLSNAYFKDFAKAEDTIRVAIANVAQARAARIVKKGELTVKTSNSDIIFENKDIKADETVADIVLDAEALAKIADADDLYFIYKNLTVTKIELVEKSVPVVPEPVGVADGTYYIKNVATGKFLAGANSWGTQGSVTTAGVPFIVTKLPEGGYSLQNTLVTAGNKFLGANLYVDATTPAGGFTIEADENNAFVITLDGKYLAEGNQTGSTNDDILVTAEVKSDSAKWLFLTAEEAVAALAVATRENPVDATFLISNPNFNRNTSTDVWTVSADCTNKNLSGGADGNRCAESYHSPFTISQVLANAPAGVYQLTAQGFYRQDDAVEEPAPVFFANDKTAAIPVKTGTENSMSEASTSFTNKLYTIEPIEFIVTNAGLLTIGVKNNGNTHQWVIWDNFQLTYLSPEVPEGVFKSAYEEALAAAKAALGDNAYEIVTGDEKTALAQAIADNTTVEDNDDAYKAAISALNAATSAFKDAKADYTALAAAKTEFAGVSFSYAAAEKKTAAEATTTATATNAADAKTKTAAIYQAYRQYAESHALAEGVENAVNKTSLIVNPDAEEAIAEPWAVVLGEGSGGALNILNGEPWTDGEGNNVHKYFDGGNWGANAWDVSLQQEISLPAGKYMLTAKGRASADVTLTLFAGETKVNMPAIGSVGGLFNRGWNDTSVEFELTDEGAVTIGVQGVTQMLHNWMSFSNFRLVQLSATSVGISTVNAAKQQSGVVYNLQGQQVKKAQKGLYIIGGKKVMVK